MNDFRKLNVLSAAKTEHLKDTETSFWKQFKNPVLVKEHASIQAISFQGKAPYHFALCTSTRVQLYDANTLAAKKTISRFSDVALSCQIRHDGKLLVAGDASGLVQLFDLNSRAILRTLNGHTNAVRDVGFVGSGDAIYSTSDDSTACIWDVATQTATNTLLGHSDYVNLFKLKLILDPNRRNHCCKHKHIRNRLLRSNCQVMGFEIK